MAIAGHGGIVPFYGDRRASCNQLSSYLDPLKPIRSATTVFVVFGGVCRPCTAQVVKNAQGHGG